MHHCSVICRLPPYVNHASDYVYLEGENVVFFCVGVSQPGRIILSLWKSVGPRQLVVRGIVC